MSSNKHGELPLTARQASIEVLVKGNGKEEILLVKEKEKSNVSVTSVSERNGIIENVNDLNTDTPLEEKTNGVVDISLPNLSLTDECSAGQKFYVAMNSQKEAGSNSKTATESFREKGDTTENKTPYENDYGSGACENNIDVTVNEELEHALKESTGSTKQSSKENGYCNFKCQKKVNLVENDMSSIRITEDAQKKAIKAFNFQKAIKTFVFQKATSKENGPDSTKYEKSGTDTENISDFSKRSISDALKKEIKCFKFSYKKKTHQGEGFYSSECQNGMDLAEQNISSIRSSADDEKEDIKALKLLKASSEESCYDGVKHKNKEAGNAKSSYSSERSISDALKKECKALKFHEASSEKNFHCDINYKKNEADTLKNPVFFGKSISDGLMKELKALKVKNNSLKKQFHGAMECVRKDDVIENGNVKSSITSANVKEKTNHIKQKKQKSTENNHDNIRYREKVNSSDRSNVLSARKMNQTSISANSKTKTSQCFPKKQKHSLKEKKQQNVTHNEAKKTTQNAEKSRNNRLQPIVNSKDVAEKTFSSIGKPDAVSQPANEVGKYRITQTKGQIELFNTKDEQEGDLDKSTVYFGKVPYNVDIYEVKTLFEKIGIVESIRLMINPESGVSLGFGFVTFIQTRDAEHAITSLSEYEICQNRKITVRPAKENKRLFVANVLKSMSKEDMIAEFSSMTYGLVDVITYKSLNGMCNRGFCFLEYESHRAASDAKKRLVRATKYNCLLMVDWADPAIEPSAEVMATVKRVYVANLSLQTSEGFLQESFEEFGAVERVKKIKNYAFIHFKERRCALEAIRKMNERVIDGEIVKVMLSKPPIEPSIKQGILRKREQRLTRSLMKTERQQPTIHVAGRVASPNSEPVLHQNQKLPVTNLFLDRQCLSPSGVQQHPSRALDGIPFSHVLGVSSNPLHSATSSSNLRCFHPTSGYSGVIHPRLTCTFPKNQPASAHYHPKNNEYTCCMFH